MKLEMVPIQDKKVVKYTYYVYDNGVFLKQYDTYVEIPNETRDGSNTR